LVTNNAKKWVFRLLVKDDKDIVGLLAYSLYKHRKNEIAEGHRSRGVPEAEISQKLSAFHDESTVGATAIDQFRERGNNILAEVVAQAENRRNAAHQAALDALKKDHAKELLKCRKEAMAEIAAAAATKVAKTHWAKKTLLWLVSGIPGAVSTVVLVVVIYGVMAILAGEEKRNAMAASGLNTLLGEKAVAPIDPAAGPATPLPKRRNSQ
jgi:hypothetical protein